MRPLVLVIFSAFILRAAAVESTGSDPAPSAATARAAATEALLNERNSEKSFDLAAEQARKAGVPPQTIAEARFLFHVDRNENRAIAAMAPDLLKLRDSFKQEDTVAFASKNDWLAVIEYAQALAALEENNKTAFKNHITEAFWLSPGQAPAFAPLIERFHLKEAMRGLKIDLSTTLAPVETDAKPASLAELAKGGKALLLHFWSPESDECVDSLPDFNATAPALAAGGIRVVTVMPPRTPENLTDKPAGGTIPKSGPDAVTMRENLEKKLSAALRVANPPTFALLSPDGAVLFNGSPADPEFWSAAAKVSPSIKRPEYPVRESSEGGN